MAETADARRSERRVHLGVGVQVSPWLLTTATARLRAPPVRNQVPLATPPVALAVALGNLVVRAWLNLYG